MTLTSDPIARDGEEIRGSGAALSRSWAVMTWLLVLIAIGTSLAGLLTDWAYSKETADWRLQARAQDVGNLISVIALVVGHRAVRRGRAAGWQVWFGSLIYLAYAFTVYAFTVHFGPLFLGYVAALGLAAYSLILATASGAVPVVVAPRSARLAGSWLIGGMAALFGMRWLSEIISAQVAGQEPAGLGLDGLITNPVHVIDLALLLPGMVLTVVAVRRRRRAAGFWLGTCLVFAALMSTAITVARVLTGASVPAVAMLGVMTIASVAVAVVLLRAQVVADR